LTRDRSSVDLGVRQDVPIAGLGDMSWLHGIPLPSPLG
jgi:hypothetical protein